MTQNFSSSKTNTRIPNSVITATQNNLKLMGEWRYHIHIFKTLLISLKQQPPDWACIINNVCFKSILKWLMYVSRFTVFPNAKFNFSLVTLMGNKIEEFTTGGEYWLSGAQPSSLFGILYCTHFTLTFDDFLAFLQSIFLLQHVLTLQQIGTQHEIHQDPVPHVCLSWPWQSSYPENRDWSFSP